MPLELWGPWYKGPRDGEFLLITTDWSSITVEPGSVARNIRNYSLTGKSLSSGVKIEVVAGELIDPSQHYDIDNLKKPYTSCDSIRVAVVPEPSKVLWEDYYAEVIPAIAAGLAEYNDSHATKVTNKAGFLLVQTFCEQSPGATGKPSQHGNRMFNVQALMTWKDNKMGPPVPGQEEPGASLKSLSQGEGATGATRTPLSSPTFYYESPKRAVTHYLKVLQQRYGAAYTAIIDGSGGFARFADALQAAKFATHQAYASDLKARADSVIRQGKAWLNYELGALDHDIASSAHDSERAELSKQRVRLADALDQLNNFKP